MTTALKYLLTAFILTGIAISLYGGAEVLQTVNFVQNAAQQTTGTFTGYDIVTTKPQSSTSLPKSVMRYPQFEFVAKDGQTRHVRESKQHISERFVPGQTIEIIVSPYGDHRLAGFYSLYVRDLCILALGLCFVFIPLLIWRVVIPSLTSPAGEELTKEAGTECRKIFSSRIGPVTVGALLKGGGIFMALAIIVTLGSALTPYLQQMRLGFGYGLIEAMEEERFDEARDLIIKKEGINRVTEHDQSPLHLALEKNRLDLARLLIDAGADVNAKSKMIYQTPLELATHSGDGAMVKLLLSKGALPDGEQDESPPVFIAIMQDHDEIARILIESGCDLQRQYISGGKGYTVGDLAVIAGKPALVNLVRQRGGVFTRTQ